MASDPTPHAVTVERTVETVFERTVTVSVYAKPEGRKSREVVAALRRDGEDSEIVKTFSETRFVEPGLFTPLCEFVTRSEFDPITTEEQIGEVLDRARMYVAKAQSTRKRFRDGSTSAGVVECTFGCGRSISPDEIKPTGWLVDGSVVNRDDVFHACPYHVDKLRELEQLEDGVPEKKPLDEVFGGGDGDA